MASSARVSYSCVLVVLMLWSAVPAFAYEPSAAIRVHGAGRKVGGRVEVKDVEGDAEVQELGRFCVEEHNRRAAGCCEDGGGGAGGRLEFAGVMAAQRQVVSGIKYYLRVAAVSGGGAGGGHGGQHMFDAVVVVKPWLESRTLLSFAPVAAK